MTWKKVKVGDLGRVVTGKTPKTSEKDNYNGDIMFVTPSDDMDSKYIYSTKKTLTEKGRDLVKGSIIPNGSVCVSCIGSDLGKVVITTEECVTNQQINSIVVDTNRFDTDFVYYAMLILGKELNFHSKTSTAVPIVNKSSFSAYEIACPSLDEQKKIAGVMSLIDRKIELNKKINDNLLQQAEAIYKEWFCDHSVENGSTSWPNTTIGEITSLVVRGITPKYNDSTDQIVINQKCIRNHTLDLTPARRHLPKAITEKWLMQGDLLINSTGEGTLGRVAQVWFIPNNLTVDSHVTIVRPKTAVLRNYIGLWGLTHETEIESLHTGSTGQTELPRERVKAMELPLPDDDTLSRFNEIITPMTQMIVKNQQENTRLAELRDILLPRLMSGELDVSGLDL